MIFEENKHCFLSSYIFIVNDKVLLSTIRLQGQDLRKTAFNTHNTSPNPSAFTFSINAFYTKVVSEQRLRTIVSRSEICYNIKICNFVNY